jgi:hypothetical protein
LDESVGQVNGLSQRAAEAIIADRKRFGQRSVTALARRCRLSSEDLGHLHAAGALDVLLPSLTISQRAWVVRVITHEQAGHRSSDSPQSLVLDPDPADPAPPILPVITPDPLPRPHPCHAGRAGNAHRHGDHPNLVKSRYRS